MRILITGGTGLLGSAIANNLQSTGHTIRIMSRGPAPVGTPHEWATADLAEQTGLAAAVCDVDVIVHCASQSGRVQETDVLGTQALLEVAKSAGVGHVVYPSIIGIDKIDLSYYKAKLEAEDIVSHSGIPYTIGRLSQFHHFAMQIIDTAWQKTRWMPVLPLPTRWQFQTIDVRDVATLWRPSILGQATGFLPAMAGPEILTLGAMTSVWRKARGIIKPVVNLSPRTGISIGFTAGFNTLPGTSYGSITWKDYIDETYGPQTRP